MPALFDVSTHGLLVELVETIGDQLEAQTLLAEKLLGLTKAYPENEAAQEIAELAVARQVRRQASLGLGELDHEVISSWGEDGVSQSVKDGVSIIDPTALILVASLPGLKCLSERLGYKNNVRSNRG